MVRTLKAHNAALMVRLAAMSLEDEASLRPVRVELCDEGDVGAGSTGYSPDMSELVVRVDDGGISCMSNGRVSLEKLCWVLIGIRHEAHHIAMIAECSQLCEKRVFHRLAEWLRLIPESRLEKLFVDWVSRFGNDYYYEATRCDNLFELDAIAASFDDVRRVLDGYMGSVAQDALLKIAKKHAAYAGGRAFENVDGFVKAVREHASDVETQKKRFRYFSRNDDSTSVFITRWDEADVKSSEALFDLWCAETTSGWEQARIVAAHAWYLHPEYHALVAMDRRFWRVRGLDVYEDVRRSYESHGV